MSHNVHQAIFQTFWRRRKGWRLGGGNKSENKIMKTTLMIYNDSQEFLQEHRPLFLYELCMSSNK